ncbi:hypothetical protein CMO86_02245 [Candidatus Woesearchaeota archaeon]|nr:hypothetical protein [Candidatus Woesearchaeota archaeon]|tara:strand:- start:675 stop:896 length:222 start_codon:yes stop_codon:yes gene_type:complete
MATRLHVKGYSHLVREMSSSGIVNTNVSEYETYMKRIRAREEHGDQIRNAVKDINNLKTELREIKNLLKEIVK